MRTRWNGLMLVALAALMLASAAALRAQTMPRLPADELPLAKSADSPGRVKFSHSTHVDSAKPDCIACHARDFTILKASAGRRPILHANFEKKRQCGACHDGKHAFAIEADCTNCHAADAAGDRSW
jgi:c(7)-type cytochrome triheme protein